MEPHPSHFISFWPWFGLLENSSRSLSSRPHFFMNLTAAKSLSARQDEPSATHSMVPRGFVLSPFLLKPPEDLLPDTPSPPPTMSSALSSNLPPDAQMLAGMSHLFPAPLFQVQLLQNVFYPVLQQWAVTEISG